MFNLAFNPVFSLSDVIAGATFISIIVGGIFALHTWNVDLKRKRSEYIKTLFDGIRKDPRILFYYFEYNKKWYDEEFHNSENLERDIDYTLSYFSYVCYLKNNNIISKKDFQYFCYEIERIVNNDQFKYYMYNLYHFSNKCNQSISFIDLFNYAKSRGCFEKDFWDKSSQRYPHYLNF